jgi:hypothetical protein
VSDGWPDAKVPAELQALTLQPANEEQMGSTFSGNTAAADAPRLVAPQQIRTDRGIDGRADSCA